MRPIAEGLPRTLVFSFVLVLGAWAASGAQSVPKAVTALRVCADPNNLPFSNRAGQGFENRIAALLGRELGLPVRYTWHPQGQGFVRKTLNTGSCDLIIGVPGDYGPLRTSSAYYRSTYVFVYRADQRLRIGSLDDAVLRRLRIGVQLIGDDYQNTPPAQALAARGIIDNVRGFPIFANYALPNPEARIIDAVATREIDVAIVWGPLGGYFAARAPVSLTVVPLPSAVDASGTPFAFDIAMGVRRADDVLVVLLDQLLEKQRPAIEKILAEYNVPVVRP
jgi:quinoprotein dehydrogenase-associated probable ABC transporter substrate-binding protein